MPTARLNDGPDSKTERVHELQILVALVQEYKTTIEKHNILRQLMHSRKHTAMHRRPAPTKSSQFCTVAFRNEQKQRDNINNVEKRQRRYRRVETIRGA
jgi:hypothetical protein